jgi:hypothetical protein
VLEVLEGEQTLNEIASKYELLPANVKNWKKIILTMMNILKKISVVKICIIVHSIDILNF